jgi:hypothetical protein
MDCDKEDLSNGAPEEVELEYEECNYDVLYENLNNDEAKKQRKIHLTEYQRARTKYLPP